MAYLIWLRAWALFWASLSTMPFGPDRGAATRLEVAQAVASATWQPAEVRALMSVARWESGYADDVVRCDRFGRDGDRTAWQIVPNSEALALRLCISVRRDAVEALRIVRWSFHQCRRLPWEERLAAYARGTCRSLRGRALSRERLHEEPRR